MLKRCIAIASTVTFAHCSVSRGPVLLTFFSFVVLTHLASPIFRNHTTPNPPQVGTLHKYVYARAASAITSWNAVYSITCRLGSQEQIAISTSLNVLYLRVRDAFPIIILIQQVLCFNMLSQHITTATKTRSLNHISFQDLPCHLQDWP